VRILFFGTPAFAVPSLRALAQSPHEVVAVVTQPDRPRGRGQKLVPSEVKAAAAELGLDVWQPQRLRDGGFDDRVRESSVDLGVVAAYGRILSGSLLALPRLGMINVHASLLPRWRGAAPVHRAVIAGDPETGVTIMQVVEALDAGPMLARLPTPIGIDETSGVLEKRLADLGAGLLVETVNALARGPVTATAQTESAVTYAAKLERHESSLDWQQPAQVLHNLIRGLQPWPVAAAVLHGRRVMLRRSHPVLEQTHTATPGTILTIEPEALVVAASAGVIHLLDLQPEGRPVMTIRDYLNGHHVEPGDRFERWMPPAPQ
jgi:methionyl-tRNA formyltransferase